MSTNINVGSPALVIVHAVTQDNFNGQPWMPDGSDLWCIVHRANGVTRWRRITLETAKFRIGCTRRPHSIHSHQTAKQKATKP